MANPSAKQTTADITHSLLTSSKRTVKSNGKHLGGRPTGYRKEYADQARKLCLLLGAEDKHLAEIFDVSERTVNRWKKAHPEFCQSIRDGKLAADMIVVSRLYDRAVGMSIVKTHFSTYQGDVTAIEYLEQIPPDVKAQSFWLRNRQGDHWKEVFARAEEDGGAFSIIISNELHPDDQKRLSAKIKADNREILN